MSDYEAELRGVVLTCDGDDELNVRAFEGLGGPELDSPSVARTGSDGSLPNGADRLPSRQMVIEGLVNAGSAAAAMQLRHALVAAWGPVREGMVTLRLRLAGVDYEVDGRPGKVDAVVTDLPHGVLRFRLPFNALDPRLYGPSRFTTLSASSVGGFVAPVTFPYSADAFTGLPGDASLENGTFDTHWFARVYGPSTNPRISLGETGEVVELLGEVPEGSILELSSREGTIRLDGSPRPTWLTYVSRWFVIPPGASTIRYRSGSGTGTADFIWRPAWL